MAMSSRKYAVTRNEKLMSKKKRFGTFSFRSSEALKHFTIEKFCTEI